MPRLLLSDEERHAWLRCEAPGCVHLRGKKYEKGKFVGFHSHCCIDCRIGLSDTPQGHTDNCLANDGRRRACSTSRRSTRLTLKSSKEHGKASLVQNHPRTPKGADEELLGRSFMFTHPLERASCRPSVRLSSSLCAGRRDEHVLGALYASGTAQGACKAHLSR